MSSRRRCSRPSLVSSSVLALCISVVGGGETGTEGGTGEMDGRPGPSADGGSTPVSCEGPPMRCRSHIHVPGILTFRYTPFAPMLMLNGAAPTVPLRPRAVRFNLTPGSTLKVLRNRQPITSPICFVQFRLRHKSDTHKTDTCGSQLKSVLL